METLSGTPTDDRKPTARLIFDSGCCKWLETTDEQCVEQLCALHAAAPALLAACESAVQWWTSLDDRRWASALVETLQAAIDQAHGEAE